MTYYRIDFIAEIKRTGSEAIVTGEADEVLLRLPGSFTDDQIHQIINLLNAAYDNGIRHGKIEAIHEIMRTIEAMK